MTHADAQQIIATLYVILAFLSAITVATIIIMVMAIVKGD